MEGGISEGGVIGIIVAVGLFMLVIFFITLITSQRPRTPQRPSEQLPPSVSLATLHARHGGTLERSALTFDHRGVEVRIDIEASSANRLGRVLLQLRKNLAPVSFGPEATFTGGDIRTGDTEFDGVVKVGGDVAQALLVLTPEARRLVQRAVLAGFRMDEEGGPRLRISTSGDDLEPMMPHLTLALGLAPLLGPSTDKRKVLERLRTEPLDDARMALAIQFPYHDLEPHVAELASLPEDELRLAFASRLDRPELWRTLPQAALIALLRNERPAIVHMAIAALGRFGTVDAVSWLESKKSYDKKTQELATDAILAIQSRATGSRGDLALAAHEGDGGLALSPDTTAR